MRPVFRGAVFVVVMVAGASCTNGDGGSPASPDIPTREASGDPDWGGQPCIERLDGDEPDDKMVQAIALSNAVSATPVTDQLEQPTTLAFRCGDDDAVYVGEKDGRVVVVREGAVESEPLLDLSDVVNDAGVEQGLLGIAFSPEGDKLYVDFTGADDEVRVVEFSAATDGDFDRETARELLVIPHPDPEPVHQAGHLTFGPDGMLYIAMGDGGPDQREEAQNIDSLYGSILRIDADADADAGDDAPYGVPSDNPFVGADEGRAEIWAWGLRNPWRFSFDRATADLWIGDVGDLFWEEVSMVPFDEAAGTNFGWPAFEGSHPHRPSIELDPDAHRPPVYDFAHPGGCGVIGGFVYRGSAIPDLRGAYVFGDLCTGRVDALVLDENDAVVARVPLTGFEGGGQPIAFAEAPDGELLVTTFEPGALWRLEPDPADTGG